MLIHKDISFYPIILFRRKRKMTLYDYLDKFLHNLSIFPIKNYQLFKKPYYSLEKICINKNIYPFPDKFWFSFFISSFPVSLDEVEWLLYFSMYLEESLCFEVVPPVWCYKNNINLRLKLILITSFSQLHSAQDG